MDVYLCKCGKDLENFACVCICVRGVHFRGTAADGGCCHTNHQGTDLTYAADNAKKLLTVLNTFVLTFISTVAFFPLHVCNNKNAVIS